MSDTEKAPSLASPPVRLTVQEAIISRFPPSGTARTVRFRHPLHGAFQVRLQPDESGSCRIPAPDKIDPSFPQLDMSGGEDWAAWPAWRLHPDEQHCAEPLAWATSGMETGTVNGARLEFPPGLVAAPAIASDALSALTRRFGPLPWPEIHLLLELQQIDYGHEKGYAMIYPSGMWCRGQFRPDSTGKAPRDRRTAVELIVHEILHHVMEFDTPAGHMLTEGLVTWLARRLVVESGLARPDWLIALGRQARRELRSWHLQGMRLPVASRRFFLAEAARRTAYRKGFLLAMELDAVSGDRLADICAALVRRAQLIGHRLTERQFVAALDQPARDIYMAATCLPRPYRA